ncbi:MAG: DUF2461 domain-containing protein [Bryobacteraceae bacterium]
MGRATFRGFPPAGIKFLKDLAKNNDRDWFQARKEIYDSQVKAPMIELLEAINVELKKFAPDYVCDPAKAIYRLYRDTRFSKDKTPYKTHIAAVLPRRGLQKHAGGGFYFSVSPTAVEIASGVYMPGPEELLTLRMHLSINHAAFRKIDAKVHKLMGELQGEQLVKVPKGFHPDQPAADLIRRKQFFYYKTLDAKLATSPDLFKELIVRFRTVLPAVEYLNAPLLKRTRVVDPTKLEAKKRDRMID